MAAKAQRARRVGGIAIGLVKAIFRTGRTWGTARARMATVRRPEPTVSARTALALGTAGGVAAAYFLDPQNGKRRRQAAFTRATAASRRDRSLEEADGRVDPTVVRMAAGNGAAGPVSEKEAAAAAA